MMKKFTAVTAALAFCTVLTACDNSSDSKPKITAKPETETEEDTAIHLPESAGEVESETETDTRGTVVGDLAVTGITFILPPEYKLALSTNVDDNLQPKRLPVASDEYDVATENGDSIELYVTKGQKYEDFNKIEQEDLEKSLKDSEYDDYKITSFEKISLKKYPVIKSIYDVTYAGQSMTVTNFYIDVYDDGADGGYCYNFTFTDISEENDEDEDKTSLPAEVFETITIDAEPLIQKYPNPQNLYKSQTNN